MEWLERLNRSLQYIEDHLDGAVDYKKAAQSACCSSYQYQRLFSALANLPLSEYIRKRRLTLAAFDLQRGAKVLDTALKYGYESPEAFCRAFAGMHGVPPSLARKTWLSHQGAAQDSPFKLLLREWNKWITKL